MATRKKRSKPKATRSVSTTAKLDDGWESFITGALKAAPRTATWPDPLGSAERRKPARKAAKRAPKK